MSNGGAFLKKDTSKILEELKFSEDFNFFYNENSDILVKDSLCDMLNDLIIKKGLKKAQVIKRSELSDVYAYQIFSGIRVPERKKLLSLAIGMLLNLDEVQSLLKCAGYAPLYVKIPFDSVVIYGIFNKLSVIEINELLFEYDLETLG